MDDQAPSGDNTAQSANKLAQTDLIPWWFWLIPIVVLVVATGRMPYGYYTFTRIVVSGFAFFLAFVSWQRRKMVWFAILCGIAILFNPIVPIWLPRSTWHDLDVGVSIIFAAHLVLVRLMSGVQNRNLASSAGQIERS